MNFSLTIKTNYLLFFSYVKISGSKIKLKQNFAHFNILSSSSFCLTFPDFVIHKTVHRGNIRWSPRSLDNVFMSWRYLEDVFSITVFHLPRHLQEILKTSPGHFERQEIVTLKTSWRRFEEMLSRCLQDKSWGRLKDIFGSSCRPKKYVLGRNFYLIQKI